MINEELTDREKNVLRYIIQQFILTASPVGSRNIARRYDLNFSPATVRNIMSDLEDSGFINHPHTSAGRVPTDKGYRFYVDTLMQLDILHSSARQTINATMEGVQADTSELLAIASRLLSSITSQLACVVYPRIESGVMERIQLVAVSSTRLLIVMSIRSGLIKTITLELNAEISDTQLQLVQELLNERLAGLSLKEIRTSLHERIRDISDELNPIITVFLDSADKIFTDAPAASKAILSGAGNLFKQPEFENPEKLQTVIELIEDKDIIVHVFENAASSVQNVNIVIGTESRLPQLGDFSLVTKEYRVGDVVGTLGVVGPKRMEYAKIVAIVDYIATILTDVLTKN